jgi:hypothetical protein
LEKGVNMEELTKNITWDDVKNDPNATKVLDHGFVVLQEIMGSDSTIAESARVSYGKGTKTTQDDKNLLRYLMRHKHTSPFEMAEMRFLIKVPIFVWRQITKKIFIILCSFCSFSITHSCTFGNGRITTHDFL